MAGHKKEMALEVLRDLASRFFAENGTSKASLITVTKVESSPDRKFSKIFFTVYPETMEKQALEFAKRNRAEFRDYIKKESLLSRLPFIDFEIDYGEKNRQQIDQISNSI